VIWRRTIVLLVLAAVMSLPIAIEVYRDSHVPCKMGRMSEVYRTGIRVDVVDEAAVGFRPCFVDGPESNWWRALVLGCFFLWVGFFSSLAQDLFLYVRGRRCGTIVGRFRWLR
jgi:hypothetical protein